jgi:hypothetical protein
VGEEAKRSSPDLAACAVDGEAAGEIKEEREARERG